YDKHPADEAIVHAGVDEREHHRDEPHDHREQVTGDLELALAERHLELVQEERGLLGRELLDRAREFLVLLGIERLRDERILGRLGHLRDLSMVRYIRPVPMLSLTDDLGRTLHFARPPQRIVSLVPSDTHSVIALGVSERLVGRTTYCDSPE